jgi:hypothetical protein
MFQVTHAGTRFFQSHDQATAENAFEALCKRHPQHSICLVKVDILKSSPAQQAFNQVREQQR